jgi:hypothetical protein
MKGFQTGWQPRGRSPVQETRRQRVLSAQKAAAVAPVAGGGIDQGGAGGASRGARVGYFTADPE